MLRISAAALLAWVTVSLVGWAASDDYRLSGIVGLDGGERRAVIKRPQGDQQIYRAADEVDGNPILEIGDRWVRIRFPDGERRLSLSGGKAVEASPAAETRPPSISSVEATPELVARLKDVATRRGRVGDDNAARRALNRALGLRASARIVAIDHEPLGSADQMIERLGGMLREGRVPMKLELDDGAGRRSEFYLSPVQKAEAASGSDLQGGMQ